MFKIFHRGHKVQFDENELAKQDRDRDRDNSKKRNSLFYTEDKYFEENDNNNNNNHAKSPSSSNQKSQNSNTLPSKRYSSMQHLSNKPAPPPPQPANHDYDDEHDDPHGFKEKLMNRYTNVTTLLMRSFRKAKNKKKEEKYKSFGEDSEISSAIYRPFDPDNVHNSATNNNTYSRVSAQKAINSSIKPTLNSTTNTKTSNERRNSAGKVIDDDKDDDVDNDDDENQDDEEDDNAVPVFIGVKKISDEFVDYPLMSNKQPLTNTTNNNSHANEPSASLKPQAISKPEIPSADKSQAPVVQSVINTLKREVTHSKPQAPVRPDTNSVKLPASLKPEVVSSKTSNTDASNTNGTIRSNNIRLNGESKQMNYASASRASAYSLNKCTPLIDERKKIFENNTSANSIGYNHTISSANANKLAYINSVSRRTAAELTIDDTQPPKINSIKLNKNFEKFNNGTASMVTPQPAISKEKEPYKSSLSINGISSSNHNSVTKENSRKTDRLTINSMDSARPEQIDKPSAATVKRSKTFTQQLSEMLEQYKKLGMNTSTTSTDKLGVSKQTNGSVSNDSIENENYNNNYEKTNINSATATSVTSILRPKSTQIPVPAKVSTRSDTNQISRNSANYPIPAVKPSNNSTNLNGYQSSTNSEYYNRSVTSNSRIPTRIGSHNVSQTENGNHDIYGHLNGKNEKQIQNNAKENYNNASDNANKYGIIKNAKEAYNSEKENYLRSVGKVSARSLKSDVYPHSSEKMNRLSNYLSKTDTPTVDIESKFASGKSDLDEEDIYSHIKTSENGLMSEKAKIFSRKFYGNLRNKMKRESYIKAASEIEDYKNSRKSDTSDGEELFLARRKLNKAVRHMDNDYSEKKSSNQQQQQQQQQASDEFKTLVNVLDKQDVDFKLKFFNCLMPKLWDATLPYEEYVELNKLMTALFGEKYHELDQSTRNLAHELRKRVNPSKYELKEYVEKSQAYERDIKRLIKEYLMLKSSKNFSDLDESMNDHGANMDERNGGYTTVNHLISTLKRRQIKDYSSELNHNGNYRSSVNTTRAKEANRSDYECYSDNAYASSASGYKTPNHRHRKTSKNLLLSHPKSNAETKSSLFLKLNEQEDASEDGIDYASKNSDVWNRGFESPKIDNETIYEAVNYRNNALLYKHEKSNVMRDKLRTSLQNFSQLKPDSASEERFELQQQQQQRNGLITDNRNSKSHVNGYNPQARSSLSKRPSYPDIVIESTLDDNKNKPVIASFQPTSSFINSQPQRISSSSHSISSDHKSLVRPKSPNILSNGGQRLQAYKPKLLSNQLIQPSSSSITQESTLNSSSKATFDEINTDMFENRVKLDEKMNIARVKEALKEQLYYGQKGYTPDVLAAYEKHTVTTSGQAPINHDSYQEYNYDKNARLKKLKEDTISSFLKDKNKTFDDSDYESFINRKQSDLMERELMYSFNEFYFKKAAGNFSVKNHLGVACSSSLNESDSFKPSVYDKIDIYDALY